MKLSTVARRQWWTAALRGGDPATKNREKLVRSVRHSQELLGEEGESKWLTGGGRF
jgi:hypothetical protein